MAMKANYLFRETGSNLRRNITLTLASIVTVAVSLALFGIALLLRQGVDNATQRWEGGIEFVVFMNADASAAQLQAVADALDASPEVSKITFFDQDKAFEEFKDLFEGTPELIETVQPSDLPTSFRVVPSDTDPDAVEQLASRFETSPGVREVVSAQETIRNIESLTNIASFIVLLGSVFLLAAAAALIFNTIRMAMFARRREIEVMKLVGATNWFIRLPFMVEGMIQGLLGAGVAVGAVFGANWALDRYLSDRNSLQLLESFVVATEDVWRTSFLLLVIGVIVGTVGSAIAVSRFLDV
jgi:cell division transport system permease protein